MPLYGKTSAIGEPWELLGTYISRRCWHPKFFTQGSCHAVRCQISSTIVNSASDSFRVSVISRRTQARKCRVYTFRGHGMSTISMEHIYTLFVQFFMFIDNLVEINVFPSHVDKVCQDF